MSKRYRQNNPVLRELYATLGPFGRERATNPFQSYSRAIPTIQETYQIIDDLPQDVLETPISQQLDYLKDYGYTFVKKLGKGGFGEVFEMFSTNENRNIACKIINISNFPKHFTIERYVSAIINESEIHSQLSHSNIVQFKHVIHIPDQRTGIQCVQNYIFMELCNGDLIHFVVHLNAGYLKPNEARDWFTQIAGALQYLHFNGISHLDIKPSNILYKIESPNKVLFKLTDFGLSKRFKWNEPNIGTAIRGTRNYMPPEMTSTTTELRSLFGFPFSYDTKSYDIYSLGKCLAVTIAGIDSDPNSILNDCINWTPDIMINTGIDENLSDLICEMTESDPKCRFTIEQICQHPWVGYTPVISQQPKSIKNLFNLP